jgi:hypothetical protein
VYVDSPVGTGKANINSENLKFRIAISPRNLCYNRIQFHEE